MIFKWDLNTAHYLVFSVIEPKLIECRLTTPKREYTKNRYPLEKKMTVRDKAIITRF